MKKSVALIAICLLFATAFIVQTTSVAGTDTKVGVTGSEWVAYNIITSRGENEQIRSIWYIVTFVDGTNINITQRDFFKNGTYRDLPPLKGDISTGSNNIWMILLPSGLQAGDFIPSTTMTINTTKTEHVSYYEQYLTSPQYLSCDRVINELKTPTMELWWDQETGFIIREVSLVPLPLNSEYILALNYTGIIGWGSNPPNSNSMIWIVPVGIVAGIVTAIIAIVIVRKRKVLIET